MHRSRIRPPLAALVVAATLAWSSACFGATLRVPSEYPTINAALDASSSGDVVLVAAGWYTDAETRTVPWGTGTFTMTSMAFLKEGVTLTSESGPGSTILDMTGVTDFGGAPATIVASSSVTGTQTVTGFTLRGDPTRTGWGIRTASLERFTVVDCVIEDYDAGGGWGAGVVGGADLLEVEDCVFRNCRAGWGGGALVSFNHDLAVRRSRFEGCVAGGGGGAILAEGNSSGGGHRVTVEESTFTENRAGSGGGAFAFGSLEGYSLFEFTDCVFVRNESEGGGAITIGGYAGAETRIVDCLFAGNRAGVPDGGRAGGAVTLTFGSVEVLGSTFYDCLADIGSAVSFIHMGSVAFSRNVVASNLGGAAVDAYAVLSLETGCNVYWDNPEGHASGYALSETDRVAYPGFCGPARYDLSLQGGSPCLPENSFGCGLIGARDQGCGPVSVEETSWGRLRSRYR